MLVLSDIVVTSRMLLGNGFLSEISLASIQRIPTAIN